MAFDTRRDLSLYQGVVSRALPEHFATQYPKLIAFLDSYYEFMRTQEDNGFEETIANLIKNKDLKSGDLLQLEKAMAELTVGLDFSTSLTDPRLKAQLLARFYRTKGSLYSFELFFRWFFGEDVVVEYGKDKVFYLNHPPSQIGPASLRFIKNDKLYQTFALLIKVGVPVSQWRDNYKRFVHPAGFYFEGEVVIESSIDLDYRNMDVVQLDSDAGTLTVTTTPSTVGISTFSSITGLIPDGSDQDADQERITFGRKVQDFSALTITEMDAQYNTIEDAISANGPTFDEFDDGSDQTIDFSNTIETFDQNVFDMGPFGRDEADTEEGRSILADSDSFTLFDATWQRFDTDRVTFDRTN